MSEVINFPKSEEPKAEPLIWTCECGNTTFLCYDDGEMYCAACNDLSTHTSGDWIKSFAEPHSEPREAKTNGTVVNFNGDSDAAMKRIISRIDKADTLGVVVIQRNGRIATWGGIDQEDRLGWLDRRLSEAYDLLTVHVEVED